MEKKTVRKPKYLSTCQLRYITLKTLKKGEKDDKRRNEWINNNIYEKENSAKIFLESDS